MNHTAFIYSSHNCSEYIHRDWIVNRALQSADNKTILHLPMSEGGSGGEFGTPQQFGWGKFEWYFNFFRKYGLDSYPFYWSDDMTKQKAEEFFDLLANSEVVVLGGGNSSVGLARYKTMGEYFFGDRNLCKKVLHDRAARGKLTVGFSAGADQLSEVLASEIHSDLQDPEGFGLCHNIMSTLHYEPGRDDEISLGAQKFPEHMIFGLPNDSGIGVSQGVLPSGNIWQIIDFVTDKSWDIPADEFHIKTRQGVGIKHYYSDGQRSWEFQGGDRMARIVAPDSSWQDAYIFTRGTCFHYGPQTQVGFESSEEIFERY
jgi:hypothetical protein